MSRQYDRCGMTKTHSNRTTLAVLAEQVPVTGARERGSTGRAADSLSPAVGTALGGSRHEIVTRNTRNRIPTKKSEVSSDIA